MLSPASLARVSLAATIAAAGLCGSATAQCQLHIKATPMVLMQGQSAKVDVYARFPATAYAFAASNFVVSAAVPSWSFVTGGVIAGADVAGINVSQPHMPPLGIFADPQNPAHAWTGRFTPASNAPAYIELKVSPSDFWYYPSILTASAAECMPRGSETAVFVNPVRLGPVAAAPGLGDEIQTTADSFVAQDTDDQVLIAMLLPAIQGAREAATRVETDRAPSTLSFGGFTTATTTSLDQLSLNYTRVKYEYKPQTRVYDLIIDPRDRDSARGSLTMMSGEEIPFEFSDGRAPFSLERAPDSIRSTTQTDRLGTISLGWHFSSGGSRGSSHPGGINILLADGSVRAVRSVNVSRVHTQNNIKQLGLGCHNYESTGVSMIRVTPKP